VQVVCTALGDGVVELGLVAGGELAGVVAGVVTADELGGVGVGGGVGGVAELLGAGTELSCTDSGADDVHAEITSNGTNAANVRSRVLRRPASLTCRSAGRSSTAGSRP
jgi:hypothetical protein